MTVAAASVGTADGPAPETRSRRRGALGWIVIAVVILLVGGVGAALAGLSQWAARGVLDPESAGPDGARALVEVLREHGVEVVVARDRSSARDAALARDATLVLPDTPALSDGAVRDLAAAAADVVLIDPRSRTLRLLLPGARAAGFGAGERVQPRCDLGDAERAGAVLPGAVFATTSDDVTCYPSGDGWGLVVSDDGTRRVSAVDGRTLFVNESLAENGNAALGINLLGRHPIVVWYAPAPGDTDLTSGDPSLGELTPPWVSPMIVLLLVSAVAAGVWRGRRFGPLVPERLPVTVRVSETTEGRARLYARSRDAVHAADQLRLSALVRLARILGLGPAAGADEIADAAAGRLGWDRGAVRGILIDDLPRNDAQLVALRDRLRHLEEAVAQTVRPERNAP
ncbi:DUF4350 domain-containing protein [Microbacterium sp. BK668]|uniref:DUF4350 domain-containing protein n=1 Tax=Microbacterium sp. BK668 TaxID=2512118 RepID=UPI00105FEBB7|nr:DUF4350 domain-containing protein [Microbacterium sp. BK668]TDN88419.1 uncharacterized protein DUF4350 [Microbacterium sp. BK668]